MLVYTCASCNTFSAEYGEIDLTTSTLAHFRELQVS